MVDATSGAVVAEHALASPQAVLGVAASGSEVMVLQQDGIALVGDGRAPLKQPVSGLLLGQW